MSRFELTLKTIVKLTIIVCAAYVLVHFITLLTTLDSTYLSSRNINVNIKLAPNGTVTK